MQQLTLRQQQVLDYIREHIARSGYPPTQREIAGHLGINGTLGVMKHLTALEKKGYLRRDPGNSRSITLAGSGNPTVSLPVVGTVRAGAPQLPVEDIQEFFSIDAEAGKGGTFFLRVKGDSMIGACITEGDLALVRPQANAENRDIVVALVNGEATLKRFFREADHIRLQPENPKLAPIIIRPDQDDVVIIGKVVGLYRQL